jgi:multidrug efflux pump subunit AcrB
MNYIVRYLFKRPLLVNLIMIFIVIVSLASAREIKRLAYPLVNMRQVEIATIYPGASPEDVEINVTIKLEEELKKVVGINKFTSKSVENMSAIHVWLDDDADPDEVTDDIRRAVENVSGLPAEVDDKPSIIEWKMENSSVYVLAVASDTLSDREIAFHTKALKKRLLDLPGTSFINESGMPEREIQILLNREKMNQLYVSFSEVITAIRNNNLRLSGGSLESYTQQKGIVTFSEFHEPKDVENIIVRAGDAGSDASIRIKDIGRVVDGFEKEDAIYRFNSLHGASLDIAKKGSTDVIDYVDKQLTPAIEEYKSEFAPDDLEIMVLYDGSYETKARLKVVYYNAAAGFVLVVLILFLFLDPQIALWTSVGIPISIGLTLIMLPRLGVTLNSISLCGMVVVLGMVVDDAIIVSESIFSAREKGMSGIDAAVYGLKRVIKPVLGTIITTIIAFTPMYFIPGMVGEFSYEIPTIVIIMLIASFIEATTLLPVHLAHSRKKTETAKKHHPPAHALIELLKKMYRGILRLSLRFKYISLLILVLVLGVGGFLSAKTFTFNMFPIDQSIRVWIVGNTGSDANLQYTADEIEVIEEIIRTIPEEGVLESYDSYVGRDFYENVAAANAFSIRIVLTPASERRMSAEDVRDYIKEEIKKRDIASLEKVLYAIEGGGPPAGKPLEVEIIGNNNEKRKELTEKIMLELVQFGVTDIETNLRGEKEELRLLPNYEKIASAQLSVAEISSVIRTAIDGTVVTHMNTPDKQVPFRVMLDEESKEFQDPLKGLSVRNRLGRLVAIEELVYQERGKAVQNMYHYNGDRTNSIKGNIDLEKTTPTEVYAQMKEKYKNFEQENPGFKLIIGGEAEKSNEVFIQMMIAVGVAVLLIYFILILEFNSIVQPAMVIMAIPFGLIGIFLVFAAHGMDLSMMSLIGILGFSGVVVNDSLIMVDFINTLLMEKGDLNRKEILDAIVEGAVQRFRPILLTTITTAAGLFPTAYGLIGGFDAFISPMVMAMMWGLLVGTVSILAGMPVLYLTLKDIVDFFTSTCNRIFNKQTV